MRLAIAIAALTQLLGTGCVVIYAPRAETLAGQIHEQIAEWMPIEQRVDPRLADELTGAAGVKIRASATTTGVKLK